MNSVLSEYFFVESSDVEVVKMVHEMKLFLGKRATFHML